jgi:hypothetical protein
VTQLFPLFLYFYHLRPATDFAMGHSIAARTRLFVDELGATGIAAVSIQYFSRHDFHS